MTSLRPLTPAHAQRFLLSSVALVLVFFAAVAWPQEAPRFDPIGAGTELAELAAGLDAGEVDNTYLATTRTRASQLVAEAEACVERMTEERVRLEARFEPLREVDADVAPAVFDQRTEVRRLLDEAIARQTSCVGVRDSAGALVQRITEIQNQLSQQFLTNRADSVITAIRTFPERARAWPGQIRSANQLDLADDITPVDLFWLLTGAGIFAAGAGLLLRHRFTRWFAAAGGPDAEPQMRYLFPKPLAEHSPSLLTGLAFTIVLSVTIMEPSLDLAVIRIALGIFMFGVGSVIIDWATGPLSPSASIKGLIPHHVKPLRFRLRLLVFALVASFVMLGTRWLTIRLIPTGVAGRASMIFLVAVALLYVFLYLGRIPGLRNRFRLVRLAAIVALLVGIFAVLIGYQNLAGFLIHGVARTSLALFIVWVLLWLVSTAFDFVIRGDAPAAVSLRRNMGVGKDASRSGLGFMQLIADLVIWLSLLVYLIYVWDESGTTLDRLVELIVLGGKIGEIELVPKRIIGGILVFAALLVLIGWIKGWIDRRWLQHIMIERGAREALITLVGYVGFVIAVLIGLTQAGVDLGGLAIVSGALALGIGFGMQEIANNFVSGLILLFERPIRAGDFITVGDTEGFVRKISIRATEIETLDNQNVLVPNSELVSGRVTNWVLRDTQGRLRLFIGVAYGSDVEKVRDILERVANAHSEVITDGRAPAPRALFVGFGDSSLDFELRCRINRIDRRFSVISDLNFAIDEAFRAENVTIPFPQRDLHIVSYPEQAPAKPEKAPLPAGQTMRARAMAQPESITRSHEEEVEITAPIGEVWRALTEIDTITKWIAASGEFDPYIGGAYDLVFADGTRNHGRIDIYMPPRRMRLVEGPREGEEPLSSGPMTADFRLREAEGKTRLNVTVSGIPATEDWEEDYNRSQTLWRNALVELQELLSGK